MNANPTWPMAFVELLPGLLFDAFLNSFSSWAAFVEPVINDLV